MVSLLLLLQSNMSVNFLVVILKEIQLKMAEKMNHFMFI
jgi:hypothetical protein